MSQSSKLTQVIFCCGLLILSLTDAKLKSPNRICNIGVKISRDIHTSTSDALEGNGNINNRSLSAWNWILDKNPYRIPKVIFRAECRTTYCSFPNGKHGTELNSQPIYRDMLVLNQDKQDWKCFFASYEKVAVGCTCVQVHSV